MERKPKLRFQNSLSPCLNISLFLPPPTFSLMHYSLDGRLQKWGWGILYLFSSVFTLYECSLESSSASYKRIDFILWEVAAHLGRAKEIKKWSFSWFAKRASFLFFCLSLSKVQNGWTSSFLGNFAARPISEVWHVFRKHAFRSLAGVALWAEERGNIYWQLS